MRATTRMPETRAAAGVVLLRGPLAAVGVFVLAGSLAVAGVHGGHGWRVEGESAGDAFGRFGNRLVNPSLASAGDVNGDGYEDLLVGAAFFDLPPLEGGGNVGKVYLYLGGPDGPGTVPAWTHTGEVDAGGLFPLGDSRFGSSVAGAGDVNGDGFDDVIAGAPGWTLDSTEEEGAVFVFHGSPEGLSSTPDWTISAGQSAFSGPLFGGHVAPAGDVDDDGFDDVLIASGSYVNPGGGTGAVFLFYGSPDGLPEGATPETAPWILRGVGNVARAAGDVDGDGFDDIVVGDTEFKSIIDPNPDGGVFVYHGKRNRLRGEATADDADFTAVGGVRNFRFGLWAASAGDVNADGYGDLAVGAGPLDEPGRAYLWLGSRNGLGSPRDVHLPADAAWSATGPDSPWTSFGGYVAGAGDVNDDGFDDILVTDPTVNLADPQSSTPPGAAFLWFGGTDGPVGPASYLDADWRREGDGPDAYFGDAAAPVGDVDGDGRPDIAFAGGDVNLVREARIHFGTCGGSVDGDADGLAAPGDPGCTAGEPVDCDDANAAVWSTPGEVTAVAWDSAGALRWTAPQGQAAGGLPASLRFDVLRSEDPASWIAATCVAIGTPASELAEADVPAAGSRFAYLVRARNDCPAGLGTLGETSAGVERVGVGCP